MRIILLLLFSHLILSCNNRNLSKKFIGVWENVANSDIHCKITQSGSNFIIEYSQRSYTTYGGTVGRIYRETSSETMPGFYDKSKNKLLIKWKKDIDAIYDQNTDQLIFESWGAFKKSIK